VTKLLRLLPIICFAALFDLQEGISQPAANHYSQHDWPQWRGPNRDGISPESGLLKNWPKDGPKVWWRLPLGEGYSSISIANGFAYTMYDDGNDEYLVCVDTNIGKQQWRLRTDKKYRNSWGNGPRVTPIIEGNNVYILSAHAKLYAVDANTGTVKWQHDLVKELNDEIPDLGYSNSPIIEGELLLVTGLGGANHSLLVFNKKTGQPVWSSQQDHSGYSSPIIVTAKGIRQAVFFTGTKIVAVSPTDGKMLWAYPWRTDSFENVATPVFIPNDKLFFSSAHPKEAGSAVLQIKATIGATSIEVLWKSNVMQHHFASTVLHEGFLYGTDRAILKCIEASTGKEMWAQRGFGEGSLIYADGHLIVLGTGGNLALVEATSSAYKERAGAQVLRGRCFTAPSLAHGKLYLRNEIEMVCLDLKDADGNSH
jgi:outer membrane protein assembly factor BamB